LGFAIVSAAALRRRIMEPDIRPRSPRELVRRGWAINKPLAIMGVSLAILLVVTVPLIALDTRKITGVPAWIKPTKFAVSGAIYAFTFLWMLSLVKGHKRLVSVVSIITASTFLVEMLIIVIQVLRGTTSHFNNSTPLNTILFSTMGVSIVVFWLMTFIAAALLIRQPMENKALAAGIRAGLVLALIGMAVAFLMVVPTKAQTRADDAGKGDGIAGAHTVGREDGGPGLPLLDWSTRSGDLRVPHFIGLHALQVLPLIGWAIGLQAAKLGKRRSVTLVGVAGFAYLGFIAILTWQALRGQSVVSPDRSTLAALGGLLAVTFACALLALRLPNGGPVPSDSV